MLPIAESTPVEFTPQSELWSGVLRPIGPHNDP